MENKINRVDNCVIDVRQIAFHPTKFDVLLRLDSENKSRYAGVYHEEESTFYVFRKSEHIFRKTNSWGLNANMLAMLDGLKKIVILNEDTKETYTTTYENFLKNSQEFNFKFSGYDKQRFLPLSLWEKSR
jgi:hypothetical protein